jgi:hypothetical protein
MLSLALALAVLGPALAGEKAEKEVMLTGWVTDEWCGKKNANAEGKDCALKCAKDGAKLVLFSDEKMYKLADQEQAKQHVGYEVVVTGTLSDDGTLKATKFEKKESKA